MGYRQGRGDNFTTERKKRERREGWGQKREEGNGGLSKVVERKWWAIDRVEQRWRAIDGNGTEIPWEWGSETSVGRKDGREERKRESGR